MLWNCWHDDGRFEQVQASDDRKALDLVMEFWKETDQNKVSVSERIL